MLCAWTSRCYCCSDNNHPHTVLCSALYTACVDASRTVFWDRSQIPLNFPLGCGPGNLQGMLGYHHHNPPRDLLQGMLGYHPPWTDTCKNITFATPLWTVITMNFPLYFFRRNKDQNALFYQKKAIRVEFRVIIPTQFNCDIKNDDVCIEFGDEMLGYWKSDKWKMNFERWITVCCFSCIQSCHLFYLLAYTVLCFFLGNWKMGVIYCVDRWTFLLSFWHDRDQSSINTVCTKSVHRCTKSVNLCTSM